jgi:hypothetical protein
VRRSYGAKSSWVVVDAPPGSMGGGALAAAQGGASGSETIASGGSGEAGGPSLPAAGPVRVISVIASPALTAAIAALHRAAKPGVLVGGVAAEAAVADGGSGGGAAASRPFLPPALPAQLPPLVEFESSKLGVKVGRWQGMEGR